jgi:hypothetical protein
VRPKDAREVGNQDDVASTRLCLHSASLAVAAKLVAYVDESFGEVNVLPTRAQCFAEPYAREEHERDQRPERVTRRAKQLSDLCFVQRALLGWPDLRSFIFVELTDGVCWRVAGPNRLVHDDA